MACSRVNFTFTFTVLTLCTNQLGFYLYGIRVSLLLLRHLFTFNEYLPLPGIPLTLFYPPHTFRINISKSVIQKLFPANLCTFTHLEVAPVVSAAYTWSDNKVREVVTVCLSWQHWTKSLVWFEDVNISAFHTCVVVDLWQSLSEWHLLLSACVLVCRHENVRA